MNNNPWKLTILTKSGVFVVYGAFNSLNDSLVEWKNYKLRYCDNIQQATELSSNYYDHEGGIVQSIFGFSNPFCKGRSYITYRHEDVFSMVLQEILPEQLEYENNDSPVVEPTTEGTEGSEDMDGGQKQPTSV